MGYSQSVAGPMAGDAAQIKTRRGVKCVYDDDIFLVGYPKSGTTWMRFLVAHMKNGVDQVTFRNLSQYVPTIHSLELTDDMPRPRHIKAHYADFADFPSIIYIYRDGRDVMVSYYHYAIQKGHFKGSFGRFLKWIPNHRHYGHWHHHVDKALDFAERHPQRILLIRYEDMLHDPMAGAMEIARFCGFTLCGERIGNAVSQCQFEKLQSDEELHGSIPARKEDFKFFRAGRAGQWCDMFSAADMAFFLKQNAKTLQRAGYNV